MDGHLTTPCGEKSNHFGLAPIYTGIYAGPISGNRWAYRVEARRYHAVENFQTIPPFSNIDRFKITSLAQTLSDGSAINLTRLSPRDEWMDTPHDPPVAQSNHFRFRSDMTEYRFPGPYLREPSGPSVQPPEISSSSNLSNWNHFFEFPERSKFSNPVSNPIGTRLTRDNSIDSTPIETNGWTPTRPLLAKSKATPVLRAELLRNSASDAVSQPLGLSSPNYRRSSLVETFEAEYHFSFGEKSEIFRKIEIFETRSRALSRDRYCANQFRLDPTPRDNSGHLQRPLWRNRRLRFTRRIYAEFGFGAVSRTLGLSVTNCDRRYSSSRTFKSYLP
ncbi:hypothetical protein AVEN_207977-1 [Araneus ventricosus]|uniref:Uncharacterized protein n=1 Tax=Araneus ventricosus TaxID=182803 RepID=A0A4Y2T1Q4_ARAVE|nr:hypothetical protein AVEN_207977-1 [Araneus ventricosus]